MAAFVAVDCDRLECLEGWSSDYLRADVDATVRGAFEYLADVEGWVRRGDRIFCSQVCADAPNPGGESDD